MAAFPGNLASPGASSVMNVRSHSGPEEPLLDAPTEELLRDLPQTVAEEAEPPAPIERPFAKAAAAADDD